jgi:hypothetical protein
VVPSAPTGAQNRRGNPLSVVDDAQFKTLWVIPQFHFNPPCLRVRERIAQRLAGNMVNFVPDKRRQVPGFPFDLHSKLGTIRAGLIGGEVRSKWADRPGKVVGHDHGGRQPLHRVPAFCNRLAGLGNNMFQPLLRQDDRA